MWLLWLLIRLDDWLMVHPMVANSRIWHVVLDVPRPTSSNIDLNTSIHKWIWYVYGMFMVCLWCLWMDMFMDMFMVFLSRAMWAMWTITSPQWRLNLKNDSNPCRRLPGISGNQPAVVTVSLSFSIGGSAVQKPHFLHNRKTHYWNENKYVSFLIN